VPLDNKYIQLGIIILNSFTIGRIYDKVTEVGVSGIIPVMLIMAALIAGFSYVLLIKIK